MTAEFSAERREVRVFMIENENNRDALSPPPLCHPLAHLGPWPEQRSEERHPVVRARGAAVEKTSDGSQEMAEVGGVGGGYGEMHAMMEKGGW